MSYSYSSLVVFTLALIFCVHATPPLGSQRNLWQFKNMINHKGYSAFDYNGYGCACGYGGHGPKAIDETDLCCQIHDDCYGRISGGYFGCSPKLVTYAWTGLANGVIQCKDALGTCDRNTCECDKAAADCFAKHRSTYSKTRLSMSSEHDMPAICN